MKTKITAALVLLSISSSLMVLGIVLEAFTNLRSTHLLDEFFATSVMLFFGKHVVNAYSSQENNSAGEREEIPQAEQVNQPK